VARPFERLVGLETEYAIRFRPAEGTVGASNRDVYEAVVDALKQQLLTVPAAGPKDGVFLANGGAVWFEAVHAADRAGLIEGATPECRGPRQLLAQQRAQDHLLAEAARTAAVTGEITLIKNDQDSRGHGYGAQENYEATLADGWRLVVWRTGLMLLLPLVLVSWLGLAALIVTLFALFLATISAVLIGATCVATARAALGRPSPGRQFGDLVETAAQWLVRVLAELETAIGLVLFGPLAVALGLLVRAAAFVPQRRALTAFLASRAVLSGAGSLDRQDRFLLADKAGTLNKLVGFFCFRWDRPVYSFGHLLKPMLYRAWHAPREYWRLFAPRQRLQVCLGDSNLCDEAEYLRVGTTLLVLDAIEAGHLRRAPRLWRPVRALHVLAGDPSLSARVRARGGRTYTALELQAHYLEACRTYVAALADPPVEAHEVLRRWAQALADLAHHRRRLVGRLDWVTKEFLLAEAGRDAPWAARKKIDLRYHELSPEGFHRRLRDAGHTDVLIGADELDRAARTPPPGTPATTRGRYIREFSTGGGRFVADWHQVVIGRGREKRVIDLEPRPPSRPARPTASPPT
jgi:proteasome accessory factor A